MNFSEVLGRFQNPRKQGAGYTARCPAHDDRKNSLSIREGDDATVVYCHAGCGFRSIVSAAGLSLNDMFFGRENRSSQTVVYPYNELSPQNYRSVRRENKKFHFEHDINGVAVKGLNGHKRVPYRLHDVDAARRNSRSLFLPEGQRDADNVAGLDFPASSFKHWEDVDLKVFEEIDLTILIDHDKSGVEQASKFAAAVAPYAKSVKVLDLFEGEPLPDGKGQDVTDWIAAHRQAGEDMETIAERLAIVAESAKPYEGPQATGVLMPISLGSLVTENPRLRAPVIEGLLRSGEVANVVAKSKVGKSWLIYYLAFCVACGIRLFDEHWCHPGRVLIIDNELHPETLAYRLPKVGEALGIRLEDYRDRIDIISLRGRLQNIDEILLTLDALKDRRYQLIIIDALYRMLPSGVVENANEGITQVYNRLDQYAELTGAATVVVHHATKGSQGDKDVTDVGSGASAQSRAADTHIVLRPHQEEGCAVLEAVVRSWAPFKPLPLRWEFPLWKRAHGLDVEALKGRSSVYEEKREAKETEATQQILAELIKSPDTVRGLTTRVPMGYERIQRLVAALVQAGKVTSETVRIRGQKCQKFSAT